MFASIMCFGLETRTLRVHVPALTESYLPVVCISLKAGQSTYKGYGADCQKRPLRSRFRQRLIPGVGQRKHMTDQTISEMLFERFCTDTGIPFVRLEPDSSSGQRTPDYEIHLQEPPVLVEVKQIDPNREDQALLRVFAETGEYSFGGVPGDRL